MSTRTPVVPHDFLDRVPEGYYAVTPDDDNNLTFIRIARPTKGRRQGWSVVQTIHGENLALAYMYHIESGQFYVYRHGIEDNLLLLVVDHQRAAMRYADKIGRCCRCNKRLTDERSRFYSIGPECEKVMPGWVAYVEEQKEMAYGE